MQDLGWIIWPIYLFIFACAIGIIAPISGIGGGSIFVPLATLLFPFNIDFIRGVGIVMAVTTSLLSVPYLIKKGLANLRIYAVIAPVIFGTSMIGSIVGLWITSEFATGKYYITLMLGIVILLVFFILILSKKVEYPEVHKIDAWSKKLELKGAWYEASIDRVVEYYTTHLKRALIAFAAIGFLAGMFGLGAGWANVPVLNLIMGVPIKAATATSMLIITATAPAISTYFAKGAILPIIVIPSILGILIGAKIGTKLATRIRPKFIKYLVLALLFFVGLMNVIKALIWLGAIPSIL